MDCTTISGSLPGPYRPRAEHVVRAPAGGASSARPLTPWPCHFGVKHQTHRLPLGWEHHLPGADHVPGIAEPSRSVVLINPL